MRVIVCGSRHWNDRARVEYRLAELPGDTTIVVGYNPEKDTPKGADRFAYQEAQKLGLDVEPHPAHWEQHGKPAGFIRNAEMGRLGADLCIAFWDGRSNGTLHMMNFAKSCGIPVEVVRNQSTEAK